MKNGPPPKDFIKPIPADVIATAVVLACREVGADPLDVGSGKLDVVAGLPLKVRVIARARFYAASALRRLYPERNQTMIACYVGANRNSAGAFFSGLDQRIANPAGLIWWNPVVVDGIVEKIRESIAPKPVEKPIVKNPPPRNNFASFKSAPRHTDREGEKRACYDLLAEAAANTAKLQAKLPKE